MLNKGAQRRASGNMPLPFDVSTHHSPRVFPTHPSWHPMQRQQPFVDHTTPGPSAPFPYYDRYGPEDPQPPPVPTPAFREGYSNDYDPAFWRPEPEFIPEPTQSPDRFRPPPPQPDTWQGPPAWKGSGSGPWPSRKKGRGGFKHPPRKAPSNAPPPEAASTRMFEPSDNWKQTHGELDRARPYSPSQPAERLSLYSPPSTGNRNSFPPTNPRPDFYRPPPNDTEHWTPDESDPYSFPPLTTTPDRMPFRDEERSVTSVSPRSTQSFSPGYGSLPLAPKRESPELPHLEAIPRKTGPSVRAPPGSKVPSRASSLSSSSGSANVLPHMQAQMQPRAGFPVQSLPQPKVVQSPTVQTRVQGGPSPSHVVPAVATKPPSVSQAEQPKVDVSVPSSATQQKPAQSHIDVNGRPTGAYSSSMSEAWDDDQPTAAARRIHNAPAFVPSTLAIDAALMYPTQTDTSKAVETLKLPAKKTKEDDAVSDMDVSLPPTPVRVHVFSNYAPTEKYY